MHNQKRKKKRDCSPTSLVGLGETLQRRTRAASLKDLSFLIVGEGMYRAEEGLEKREGTRVPTVEDWGGSWGGRFGAERTRRSGPAH